MQQISPLNNLMLWLMASGILASMLTKNEFTIGCLQSRTPSWIW
jgi:hypothetical protein